MIRIVEETLASGKKQYAVESNKSFFGLFNSKWHTCKYSDYLADGSDVEYDAVFDTIEEARSFAGFPKPEDEIIERKVIQYGD